MKKKILNKEEIQKIWDFYYEFSKNPVLVNLYSTPQHRTSNTYRHVCLVTRLCLYHATKKNLDYDYHSLIRGAFLHDLFFYDWRNNKEGRKHHLTRHPQRAIDNAQKYFELNEKEIDIIANHMWPITITKFPHTKEGRLVMMMDKKATFIEFFNKRKKLLVFDLDGTIVDTLPDLNNSINYMCQIMGFPLRSLEHTRISIGNGVPVLIRRSIPQDTNEQDYLKALDIFKKHYIEHAIDKSVPYEGMSDVLRRLRKRGYTLAVVTNKNEDMAKKIIDHFYPKLFATVVGNNGIRKPKPAYDNINEMMNRIKVKRPRSAVYIGDTEVDYLTAKRAMMSSYIVTYGYRSKTELDDLKLSRVTYIDSPEDLLMYFPK
ncbi:MAG: HAD-IA family hydrolase [Bacilli bacterium]|nr:HAD-IA family hydrolase [Bacilli bacterium]